MNALRAMNALSDIPTGKMNPEVGSAVFHTYEASVRLNQACRSVGLIKKDIINGTQK
jgi:hypothetical protein